MLFNSWGYALFLVVAVSVYWLLPSLHMRMRMLALASCAFYGMWRWEFTFLVVFSALVDYVAGGAIAASENERVRRTWLAISLFVNLGLLIGFKYT